jgi:hypothetical protein
VKKVEEVSDDHPNETIAGHPGNSAFLITASEMRDRKTKRRRKHDLPIRSEAIRRPVAPGLKATGSKNE